MSYYEWISSIINFLSLLVALFFAIQVYKLSKKANDIAEEMLMVQKAQFKKQIYKDEKQLFDEKFKVNETEKLNEI